MKAWAAVGGVGIAALSFGSGWLVNAGRNEARLAAVEEYIRIHQAWSAGRSDVVVEHSVAIDQIRRDMADIRGDLREIKATLARGNHERP